jgi:hypothetical protein
MMDQARTTALAAILTIASHAGGGFAEEKICEIQILDEENGWPVPIVELRTTNSIRFFSDNRGSVAWSSFRKKWASVFTQKEGESSRLGEIWYAEASSPMRPWQNLIQVATNNNYTFYNPLLQPDLTDVDSPILLIEGTFTHAFAERTTPVLKHDCNQIMCRLNLDNPVFE